MYSTGGFTAVSYTHLDVYKRQPTKSAIRLKKNQSIVLEHETGEAIMSFGL